MKRSRWSKVAWAGILAGIALGYLGLVNPWMAQWGSTAEERTRLYPGAELVPGPVAWQTRAITVDAAPATTWLWLGQIGQGRAGFYSYDWLENLVGADIHNLSALDPRLAPPAPGDTIRLAPDSYLGGRLTGLTALPVAHVDPGHWFVLRGWATFIVEPADSGKSRVIVREFVPARGSAWSTFMRRLYEPAHFVMERQMLRGLRDRAEGRDRNPYAHLIAFAGFALAAAGFVLVMGWRRSPGWLAAAVAGASVPLLFAGDLRSSMAWIAVIGLLFVTVTEIRAPRWFTVPALLLLIWTGLILAPDAWIVFGWLLGAGATAAAVFGAGIRSFEKGGEGALTG